MQKIHIPHTPAHIGLFWLLAFLCYQAHQLVRLLTGAVVCAGFGSMTFTVMTPRQPCSFPMVLALSGPLLTYGLAYAGIILLRSPRLALFAYALIFASFAHLRFIQTLSGRGDELVLAAGWSLTTSQTAVAVAVLLIGVPPVVAAYRVIANRRRNLVFIASWLLPLPVLVALLLGDKYLFETTHLGMRFGAFYGIWLTVLLTDLAACALFIWLAPRYLRT